MLNMVRLNTFKIIIILSIIFLSATTCSRNRAKEKTEKKLPEKLEMEETKPIGSSVDKEGYENEFEKTVYEIGEIQNFTPETFIIITILNKKMTGVWLDEARSLPFDKQKKHIDEENLSFFNAFGTTEEQFVKYSQENIEELNNYLEEHPELISELREY